MSRDFLLVDGVLRQDALQWLYGAGDSIDVIPLYNGTRWDGVKELGPILAACRTFPLAGRIAHRSWNLTV